MNKETKEGDVVNVIESCVTSEQFESAVKYAELWIKSHNPPIVPESPVVHALARKRLEFGLPAEWSWGS